MNVLSSKVIDQNGFTSANTSHNGSSQRQLILTAMYILISAAEGEWDNGLHTYYDLRSVFDFKDLWSHSDLFLFVFRTDGWWPRLSENLLFRNN